MKRSRIPPAVFGACSVLQFDVLRSSCWSPSLFSGRWNRALPAVKRATRFNVTFETVFKTYAVPHLPGSGRCIAPEVDSTPRPGYNQ